MRLLENGGMSNWLEVFDDDDKREFFSDLTDAADLAERTGDVGEVETCLHEWRVTAQALADPQAQEALTALAAAARQGTGLDDFTEVPRPRSAQ